ncbi:MAG: hypothetical protein KC910_23340 [Candidatus Eremiobacteraeota bacterium]|nr:hypothetical protein [Candidatus Eremiobacteraeota bacterium]
MARPRFELAVLVGLVALVAWWARPARHEFRLRAAFDPGNTGQKAWLVDTATADRGGLSPVQVEYLDGQTQGLDGDRLVDFTLGVDPSKFPLHEDTGP